MARKSAKQFYSIPDSINVSPLDMPFSLRRGSVGPKKPITVGFVLLSIFVVGIYAFIAQHMLKHSYGVFYTILFSIAYWIFAVAMIRRQRTGERGYKWFIPTVNYWFTSKSRYIITRGHAGESEVMKLKFQIPIEDWDEESGIVRFTDGTVAYLVDIIGNGSSSLFQDDIDHIIGVFEHYLNQLKLETSLTVVSRQAPQDATIQKRNIEKRRKENVNKTIDFLLARNEELLTNFVEPSFKTIHQFIVLHARNEETLNEELGKLNDAYNDDLFKQMELLRFDKLTDRLRNFYNLT